MKKYKKPTLKLQNKNTFIADMLKSISGLYICKQCSACHGCRG